MMAAPGQPPFIDDGIAALRPYAITQGRTAPTHDLDLITLVKARSSARNPPQGLVEEAVFLLCHPEACSVGELSARLQQPVHAVKIVVSDLLDQGFLIQAMPDKTAEATDPAVLEEILAGLRAL
ncbi:DUF742 domain-containing protein [Streptomyces sp. NPDC002573]|uniref:DUF742 domain-containing protein n=1 Tax=Streptomyces sp. NPDC002573 TaxID=3364651 RepID=UPI00369E6BCE